MNSEQEELLEADEEEGVCRCHAFCSCECMCGAWAGEDCHCYDYEGCNDDN